MVTGGVDGVDNGEVDEGVVDDGEADSRIEDDRASTHTPPGQERPSAQPAGGHLSPKAPFRGSTGCGLSLSLPLLPLPLLPLPLEVELESNAQNPFLQTSPLKHWLD